MAKVQFPAVLVLARYDHKAGAVLAFIDDKRLIWSDGDLQARLDMYRRLEDTGAIPYTYTLANVDDAERILAERIAWLEWYHGKRESPEPDPEPSPDPHLAKAYELARVAFDGNKAQLGRLDRALALAEAGQVWDKGGGQWWVKASYAGVWTVNGGCTCPDRATWCKHRLAVALTLKARQLEKEAGSASDTPAPSDAPNGDNTQDQDTTKAAARQAVAALDAEIDDLGQEWQTLNRAICPVDANRGQWWTDRRAELERLRGLLMTKQQERAAAVRC